MPLLVDSSVNLLNVCAQPVDEHLHPIAEQVREVYAHRKSMYTKQQIVRRQGFVKRSLPVDNVAERHQNADLKLTTDRKWQGTYTCIRVFDGDTFTLV